MIRKMITNIQRPSTAVHYKRDCTFSCTARLSTHCTTDRTTQYKQVLSLTATGLCIMIHLCNARPTDRCNKQLRRFYKVNTRYGIDRDVHACTTHSEKEHQKQIRDDATPQQAFGLSSSNGLERKGATPSITIHRWQR
jgi:hypothetical protein